LAHAEVLPLHDRETGESAGRFTTRAVRGQEREALAEGARVTAGAHRDIGAAASGAALRPDQRAAFEHAAGAGGLKIIEGWAGTGKSSLRANICGTCPALSCRWVAGRARSDFCYQP
jgi:hypothetical protein